MNSKLFQYGLCATLLSPLGACADFQPYYSAKPMTATVVDAETNEPIEGVTVVANWEIKAGEMKASSKIIQLKILETVTDKSGRFSFPAWGPEPNLSLYGYIGANDPGLILFKSGYKYRGLANNVGVDFRFEALRYSDWDGKTIKMEKFKGTLKEYSSHLNFIKGPLRFAEENCNWKKIPAILIALDKERQIFRANRIDSGTYSLDYFDGLSEREIKECGSPSEFFKGQKK